jgi:hypothetical protein
MYPEMITAMAQDQCDSLVVRKVRVVEPSWMTNNNIS